MAEQKFVTFVIERQDGPNEKPYTQEFDVPYRPSLNVVAALMEIQKNPVTRDGKRARQGQATKDDACHMRRDASCADAGCGERPWSHMPAPAPYLASWGGCGLPGA